MFRRSDNPELFKALCSQYKTLCPQDKTVDMLFTKELTDEQLSKITTLTIKPSTFANVKSLNGIEQLTNLEHLSIAGQSARTHAREFEETRKRAEVVMGYNPESDYQYFADEFESGQLTDITPIYSLKKLKSLSLANQRGIAEFDFSHNSNLTNVDMRDCRGLKKISGLHTLKVIQDPSQLEDKFAYFDSRFDFSGCCSLRSVGSMTKLAETLSKNREADNLDDHIFLPTTAYCHIVREEPQVGEILNDMEHNGCIDVAKWTEIGEGGVRIQNNSRQMAIAKRYADETVRTLFYGQNPSPLDKVSGVYRWICDNIKYDYNGLELSEKEDRNKKYRKTDQIRSSYVALIDKKAVCVGISNLFNFFMADLGYSAEPVSCSSVTSEDARMTISNHQMSKVFINNSTYYCDPTWDLGSSESRYFCLNKKEMGRDHQFTVADLKVQSGESYQEILRKAGLLKTKTNGVQME